MNNLVKLSKKLMSNLLSFLGIKYEICENELKAILSKIDLLNYVDDFVNLNLDMSTDASILHLITSALDEKILFSILYEYGEIQNEKVLWDILEMKYSLNESEDDEGIPFENDNYAFSFITDFETKDGNIEALMMDDECMLVFDIGICDDEETTIDVESEFSYEEILSYAKTYEVKFDENYVSHEEWINMMHEKHLIDDFLFGEKRCLPQ